MLARSWEVRTKRGKRLYSAAVRISFVFGAISFYEFDFQFVPLWHSDDGHGPARYEKAIEHDGSSTGLDIVWTSSSRNVGHKVDLGVV